LAQKLIIKCWWNWLKAAANATILDVSKHVKKTDPKSEINFVGIHNRRTDHLVFISFATYWQKDRPFYNLKIKLYFLWKGLDFLLPRIISWCNVACSPGIHAKNWKNKTHQAEIFSRCHGLLQVEFIFRRSICYFFLQFIFDFCKITINKKQSWFEIFHWKLSWRFIFLFIFFFRDEYENVAFLYVSDDMEWGRKNLKNKHGDLVKGSFINDVTLIRRCVHYRGSMLSIMHDAIYWRSPTKQLIYLYKHFYQLFKFCELFKSTGSWF